MKRTRTFTTLALLFILLLTSNYNVNAATTVTKTNGTQKIEETKYTYSEYYEYLIEQKEYEQANNFRKTHPITRYITKRSCPSWVDYIKVIKFSDPQGEIFNIITVFAVEIHEHTQLPIQAITSYVEGTANIKVNGVSGLKWINDFDPIVTIADNKYSVKIQGNGSLCGEIDVQAKAGFEALGFSFGVTTGTKIYTSMDKYIEHTWHSMTDK
ncbi:hypothetical protein AN1V17_01790 [Vallitalea sediminicola]